MDISAAPHRLDLVIQADTGFALEIEEVYGANQHLGEDCLSTAGTASSFSATATSSSGSSWASLSSFGSAVSTGS
jgi:hypothetical protein